MSARADWEAAFKQLRLELLGIEAEVRQVRSVAGLLGHLVASPHQIEGHELEPVAHVLHGLAGRLEAFWEATRDVKPASAAVPDETIERLRH
jgi:hypothetical protein